MRQWLKFFLASFVDQSNCLSEVLPLFALALETAAVAHCLKPTRHHAGWAFLWVGVVNRLNRLTVPPSRNALCHGDGLAVYAQEALALERVAVAVDDGGFHFFCHVDASGQDLAVVVNDGQPHGAALVGGLGWLVADGGDVQAVDGAGGLFSDHERLPFFYTRRVSGMGGRPCLARSWACLMRVLRITRYARRICSRLDALTISTW